MQLIDKLKKNTTNHRQGIDQKNNSIDKLAYCVSAIMNKLKQLYWL